MIRISTRQPWARIFFGVFSLLICLPLFCVQAEAEDTTQDEDDIRNWTPRKSDGLPFRRVDEQAWRDDRISRMDFGPCLGGSITLVDPAGAGLVKASKGIAVRLGGHDDLPQAVVVYERSLLQCQGGWINGDLRHDDLRFGLLDQPANAAEILWHAPASLAWSNDVDRFVADQPTPYFPISKEQGNYRSLSLFGRRTVLNYDVFGTAAKESPVLEKSGEAIAIARHIEVDKRDNDLWLRIVPEAQAGQVALVGNGVKLIKHGGWLVAHVPAGDRVAFKLVHAKENPESFQAQPDAISEWEVASGAVRYGKVLHTKIEQAGSAGPYTQERIVPPFENPWGALMGLSGIDFMPDGRAAVATVYGDVWLVGDLDTDKPSWTRYATGMYQPLGLRVVDGKVVVLERGQLTELIDHNNDDQVDEYRCINNRWHTTGQPHSFDLCLQTDAEGNYYFFKSGAWHTPTGGCLLKVAADGSGDAEIFATGFRHPNGMGMSPDGQLSGVGQEGNWIPKTRLDLYQKGGFYGMMNTHRRKTEPKIYHRPLMWFPTDVDASGGSQVWTPQDWGPLSGQMLHLSWGQCQIIRILPTKTDGWQQGAADVLELPRTMAGAARARFSTHDGHLYIAGLMGWQTWGPWDGTLERVKYNKASEEPFASVSGWQAEPGALVLNFDSPLDRQRATDPGAWRIQQWNYHWSHQYGSARWRTDSPMQNGETTVQVEQVELSEDGKQVRLIVPGIVPSMQVKIDFNLRLADGAPYEDAIVLTLHNLALSDDAMAGEDWIAKPKQATTWGGAKLTSYDNSLTIQRSAKACGLTSQNTPPNVQIDLTWQGDLGDGAALVLRQVDSKSYLLSLSGDDAGAMRETWKNTESVSKPQDSPLNANAQNHARIQLEGRRIRIWINDKQTADYIESDTRVPVHGGIGLAWPEGSAGTSHLTYFKVTPLRPDPAVDEPGI